MDLVSVGVAFFAGVIFGSLIVFQIMDSVRRSGADTMIIDSIEKERDELLNVLGNLNLEYCKVEKECDQLQIKYNLLAKNANKALSQDRDTLTNVLNKLSE